MVIFRRLNFWLFILFLGSITTVLSVKYMSYYPEQWRYGEELGEIFYDLGNGYLASYLFYILVVFIPDRRREKKVNARVSLPLSRILHGIQTPFQSIYKINEFDKKQIDKAAFGNKTKGINLSDNGPIFNGNLNETGSVGLYLMHNIEYVDRHINEINSSNFSYDPELILLLDKIKYSSYHESMHTTNRIMSFYSENRPNFELSNDDSITMLYNYYELFFSLKLYMKQEGIEIVKF